MLVSYATTPSPLGHLLVAATQRGICFIALADNQTTLANELHAELPSATLTHDQATLAPWISQIIAYLEGQVPHLELPTDVRATAFQTQVWKALRAIPIGSTQTYGEIAQAIGKPGAARAVGQACGSNPTALIVPCHRVVGSGGALGGYRWGTQRKQALLATERLLSSQSNGEAQPHHA
jgi:AraC family transcriptional regulator of adaptative response/methylated-DNA-[protein]-cysteine methyltransferase